MLEYLAGLSGKMRFVGADCRRITIVESYGMRHGSMWDHAVDDNPLALPGKPTDR